MNEDGRKIVNCFRELREFYKSVALLLQTVNGMMQKRRWTYASKKRAIEVCEKLGDSEWWLPDTFFCFYQHESKSRLMAFISVVVDDTWGEPPTSVDQALVTAGWIDFQSDADAVMDKWEMNFSDMSHLHVWMDYRKEAGKRTDDGAWNEGDAYEVYDEDITKGIIAVRTFARLLVDIADAAGLEANVVTPLLDDISKAYPATGR